MTHKYPITAAFGVSLFFLFKVFPASIKHEIHSLANCQFPGLSLKKFDYG
jgi:hypothetical protein